MITTDSTDLTPAERVHVEACLILRDWQINPASTAQDLARAIPTAQRELANPGTIQEQIADLRAACALLRRV